MYNRLLGETGEVLYCYVNNERVFFVVKDKDKIKLLTWDKRSKMGTDVILRTPRIFLEAKDRIFFKPKENRGYAYFSGFFENELGESSYFFFSEHSLEVSVKERSKSETVALSYNLLPCMRDIQVRQGIQKLNSFVFVGVYEGEDTSSPCFGEVDVITGKLLRLNFFYSDEGEIHLSSLGIDNQDNQIIIAGSIVEGLEVKPYYDTLTLNR